jgi:hypothetical protein
LHDAEVRSIFWSDENWTMEIPGSMRLAFLKNRIVLAGAAIWALALPQVNAQVPLNAAASEKFGHLLDSDHSPDLLGCSIHTTSPALDFAFRLEVRYIVSCHLSTFEGRVSKILVIVRVTPDGGKPTLLGEPYSLPEPNADKELKQDFEMSGAFAIGEGQYQMEVLVADEGTGRTSRKRWSERVSRHIGQRAAQDSVPPGTVFSMGVRPWPIKMDTSGNGLKVTILLDVAPLSFRSPSLHAWDRAMLLQSLSSLLKQIPCASVRLRAFNLDQQRELFRQDSFDDAGFGKLADSLRNLELGTISYQVLQRRSDGPSMLWDYANQELTAADPSDAVIILGPHTRHIEEIPRGVLKQRETRNPQFVYFDYFPLGSQLGEREFDPRYHPNIRYRPDIFATLTKHLDGTVYVISSPTDLARSIQKMLKRVQARSAPPSAGDRPAGQTPPHYGPTASDNSACNRYGCW